MGVISDMRTCDNPIFSLPERFRLCLPGRHYCQNVEHYYHSRTECRVSLAEKKETADLNVLGISLLNFG